ncbi:MAG TPA: hypothetical protein VIR54_10625 [Vicinamibacterales bacterium]|jgi:hypothetical protein
MRRALVLSVGSALWALALFACSASPEEQTLLRFFVAAPTLDSTVIGKYATVGFNPQTDGIVQTFTITAMGPEHQDQKDVTIDAVVLQPDGNTARRTMVATFGKVRGRWLITGLRQTPASRTSREVSSVPQN